MLSEASQESTNPVNGTYLGASLTLNQITPEISVVTSWWHQQCIIVLGTSYKIITRYHTSVTVVMTHLLAIRPERD